MFKTLKYTVDKAVKYIQTPAFKRKIRKVITPIAKKYGFNKKDVNTFMKMLDPRFWKR